MSKKHGTDCNIFRLQDAWVVYHDPDGYDFQTPRGRPLSGKAYTARQVSLARKALHDACVVIPRSCKTPAALAALAKKVGVAHGFDVVSGNYKKK